MSVREAISLVPASYDGKLDHFEHLIRDYLAEKRDSGRT